MRAKRVLIVEDEFLILYSLAKTLEAAGMLVTTADTAEQALEALEAHPYDLCFLDLRLPRMHGLRAMELIRERWPGTRIVVMTASWLDVAEQRAVAHGADFFLEKPFDLGRIREIAAETLHGPPGRPAP